MHSKWIDNDLLLLRQGRSTFRRPGLPRSSNHRSGHVPPPSRRISFWVVLASAFTPDSVPPAKISLHHIHMMPYQFQPSHLSTLPPSDLHLLSITLLDKVAIPSPSLTSSHPSRSHPQYLFSPCLASLELIPLSHRVIMADALCGPSNPLQNLQKHTQIDRTLQQDRLVASRQSPSQVLFLPFFRRKPQRTSSLTHSRVFVPTIHVQALSTPTSTHLNTLPLLHSSSSSQTLPMLSLLSELPLRRQPSEDGPTTLRTSTSTNNLYLPSSSEPKLP